MKISRWLLKWPKESNNVSKSKNKMLKVRIFMQISIDIRIEYTYQMSYSVWLIKETMRINIATKIASK